MAPKPFASSSLNSISYRDTVSTINPVSVRTHVEKPLGRCSEQAISAGKKPSRAPRRCKTGKSSRKSCCNTQWISTCPPTAPWWLVDLLMPGSNKMRMGLLLRPLEFCSSLKVIKTTRPAGAEGVWATLTQVQQSSLFWGGVIRSKNLLNIWRLFVRAASPSIDIYGGNMGVTSPSVLVPKMGVS